MTEKQLIRGQQLFSKIKDKEKYLVVLKTFEGLNGKEEVISIIEKELLTLKEEFNKL